MPGAQPSPAQALVEAGEALSQKRAVASSQSGASRSGSPRSRDGRSWAGRRARSARRARAPGGACDTACTVIGNGPASSLTVASPRPAASRIARRVGSASAANVVVQLIYRQQISTERLRNERLEYYRPRTHQEEHMGRIVVTEFVSLDGVMEDPGGTRTSCTALELRVRPRRRGQQFKLDETMAPRRCCSAARPTRASPTPGRRARASSPTSSTDAQVRRLLDARRTPSGRTRPSSPATSPRRSRSSGEIDGEIVVHGSGELAQALLEARPRRRAAADGVPGRARRRQAPVRRDERQEAARLPSRRPSATAWRS